MENKTNVVIISDTSKDKDYVYLQEFISLCLTAGYKVLFVTSQNVNNVNIATYLGSGFLQNTRDEIYANIEAEPEIKDNLIIATNFDLTGTQRANLKKFFDLEVVDRTFVILKIFENNANSKEAKLQVDIATLTWSKNHLINKEGAFSQVTSGGGMHNKGSGEKKINLDKRHINLLIDAKKKELEKIKLARKNSRTRRNNNPIPKVAIVGYTNSGKSTLINALMNFSHNEKTTLVKNQLFATLETTTREINKYGYMKFLLTDTVGFISNLPTTLVEAFKSTLEEIKEADLLIHVVDFSNENYENHIAITNQILEEIGVKDIPVIYSYNKCDATSRSLSRLLNDNEMYCSLIKEEEIINVYRFICQGIASSWEVVELEFPFSEDYGSFCSDNYVIKSIKNKNGYQCTAYINPRTKHKYDYLIDICS